ncbi:MAG: IS5 family transposase [Calditrichaeota bacterium]|nr:MAG: IS5 family transposase [Calditrichota bacterium]
MAKQLLTDALWERIKPLLPKHKSPGPKGGRPPVDDRVALEGILYVLKTGISWEDLPKTFGCSGMTCWRRLEQWHAAGVWDQVHSLLLSELRGADKLDWSRTVIDTSHVRAMRGGPKTGPNPTDRGRLGSKHHLLVNSDGVPLAVALTAANQHDVLQALPLMAQIPDVRGKPGKPKQRPESLYGDAAYDCKALRGVLKWLGVRPLLAPRRREHGSGLGKVRWVVERTIAWFHSFRRLRIRWERRDDIHEAFMKLAVCLICFHSFVARFC